MLASVGLRVDGNGAIDVLVRFDRAADRAGRSGDRLERTARSLRAALAGMGLAVGARELIEYADSWNMLEGRIGLATRSTRMAATVQDELFAAANRARTGIEAIADLYSKTARASDQLSASQRDIIDFTETVSKGFIVSNASVRETEAAVYQLGQALQSGVLQGDELRTLREGAPMLLRAIAEHMNVTVGQLKKLGAEGKLTSQQVFEGILAYREQVEEMFARMPVTIGQTFVVLNNELRRFIGNTDNAYGASAKVATVVLLVANNLNTLAQAVGIAVVGLVSYGVAVKAAAAYTALLPLAQTIAAYVSLAIQVRTAAAAMALFSMAARDAWLALAGPVGIAIALASTIALLISYKTRAREAAAATEEFRAALAGMSKTQLLVAEADLDRQVFEVERAMARMREARKQFADVGTQFGQTMGGGGLPPAAADAPRPPPVESREYRDLRHQLEILQTQRAALEEQKEALAELEVPIGRVTAAVEEMSNKSRRAMAEFRAGLAEMIREAEHARDTSTLQGMAQEEANERFAAANSLLRMRADLSEKVISETISQTQADALFAEAQTAVAKALGLRLEATERAAVAEAQLERERSQNDAERDLRLAFRYGDAQERLRIEYEAANRAMEARAILTGEALEITLATIAAEERLGKEMISVQRIAEESARGISDTLTAVFDGTIRTLNDLFGWIKRAFTRMLVEMATDRAMQEIGKALSRAVSGDAAGRAASANANLQSTIASIFATPSVADKAAGGLQLEGVTAVATTGAARNREMMKKFASYLGAALAAASLGQMFGYSTGSAAVGALAGGLSGAGTGFMMAGTPGAIIGGIAGLGAGILGAHKKNQEEQRRLRETLDRNSQRLDMLRESFDGFVLMSGRSLAGAAPMAGALSAIQVVSRLTGAAGGSPINGIFGGIDRGDLATALKGGEVSARLRQIETQFGVSFSQLGRIARELGIELFDSAGKVIPAALKQFEQALDLAIRAATQFGNNIEDLQLRQEARNALFDLNSPGQKLKDAYEQLTLLAPDLLKQMGLANLNLDTEAGRNVLLTGLRDIFALVDAGMLTPELLGAFTDKGRLIEAILRAKAGLDAFSQTLGTVTTDFPRAMDLILYEQRYGRGTGATTGHPTAPPPGPPDTNPGGAPRGPRAPLTFNVYINNEAGDSDVTLIRKVESGAVKELARGGFTNLETAAAT